MSVGRWRLNGELFILSCVCVCTLSALIHSASLPISQKLVERDVRIFLVDGDIDGSEEEEGTEKGFSGPLGRLKASEKNRILPTKRQWRSNVRTREKVTSPTRRERSSKDLSSFAHFCGKHRETESRQSWFMCLYDIIEDRSR